MQAGFAPEDSPPPSPAMMPLWPDEPPRAGSTGCRRQSRSGVAQTRSARGSLGSTDGEWHSHTPFNPLMVASGADTPPRAVSPTHASRAVIRVPLL